MPTSRLHWRCAEASRPTASPRCLAARGGKTPELSKLAPKPFYIGYGTQDSVGPSARALADVLRGAGWPVRIAAHPVGHGAKEIYIDEALNFFRESAR